MAIATHPDNVRYLTEQFQRVQANSPMPCDFFSPLLSIRIIPCPELPRWLPKDRFVEYEPSDTWLFNLGAVAASPVIYEISDAYL